MSKPKPMKDIMKFRRTAKPQAYPLRYVEDFGAKYDFIRTSSLKGCLPAHSAQAGASPPMTHATARFMTYATGSKNATHLKYFKTFDDLRKSVLAAFGN